MRKNDLIEELRRMAVETGTLNCLGCGHEHRCSTKGCAVLREAADRIESMTRWISVEDKLPEDEGLVLVAANGRYGNITFVDAVQTACYCAGEGWILEAYPEFEAVQVSYWMPLPDPTNLHVSLKDADKEKGHE